MKILDFLLGRKNSAAKEPAEAEVAANENLPSVDLESLLPRLTLARRTAFVPVVEDGDGSVTASKFSGIPALRSAEEWPTCTNCSRPMQLFLQLDLSSLQIEHDYPLKSGHLQFFYCTSSEPSCEVDCEAYAPFSESIVLRVVPLTEANVEASGPSVSALAPKDAFPAKLIKGWQAVDDYPCWEELEAFDVGFSDDEYELLNETYPLQGEKWGGWPCWVQGVEYPECPQCSQQMRLLFQIDSEDNLPYMFGDSGCGHITYCPEHPEVMSFHWACC